MLVDEGPGPHEPLSLRLGSLASQLMSLQLLNIDIHLPSFFHSHTSDMDWPRLRMLRITLPFTHLPDRSTQPDAPTELGWLHRREQYLRDMSSLMIAATSQMPRLELLEARSINGSSESHGSKAILLCKEQSYGHTLSVQLNKVLHFGAGDCADAFEEFVSTLDTERLDLGSFAGLDTFAPLHALVEESHAPFAVEKEWPLTLIRQDALWIGRGFFFPRHSGQHPHHII